jgi:hypothetical protein
MRLQLWTDAIIDPLDTRTWISMGIGSSLNHSPIEERNLILGSYSGLVLTQNHKNFKILLWLCDKLY